MPPLETEFEITVLENARGHFTWRIHRERPYTGVWEMRGTQVTKAEAVREAKVWIRRIDMATR